MADPYPFDLKEFLATLTTKPGVYKMLDHCGEPLYVGKARNLKKRVSSYFRGKQTLKQQAMLARLHAIDVTVTRSEGEALLLESQWVKRYQPRYNICLKDDKSYPYIYISNDHPFPRVTFHRGARNRPGRYFGPYPSASAVRASLKLLQKVFPVRQCEDSYFNNRSRPCLQYQIQRCTAPCVDLISAESYRRDVEDTILFLEGKGQGLLDDLVRRMEKAASQLEFERAARYRDQIATLREVLEKQYVTGYRGDLDVIACASEAGISCVQVAWFRGGRYLGDKTLFPSHTQQYDSAKVLEAFLGQYYLDKPIPSVILLSHPIEDEALITEVLSQQAEKQVRLISRPRGQRREWLKMVQANAETALQQRLVKRQDQQMRLEALAKLLNLDELPRRLECFDISHIQGDQTVASCVVFDAQGPVKSAYRRFNIEGIVPGDDYAAQAQAVRRRFKRLQNEGNQLPDVLFIDGGKGQVTTVTEVLADLGVPFLRIVGVAKGPDRKGGEESLYLSWQDRWVHPGNHPALLLIRHIRDESHRFAISGHRQRRSRIKGQSVLESIDGLGPKRRQRLLQQFGGLQAIKKASVEALCSVEGINSQLAQRIYETFHEPGT